MLKDSEMNEIKVAIDEDRTDLLRELLEPYTADQISSGHLYSDQTIFMYACQNGSPESVQIFIDKGVYTYEVKYSDTNEVKCALRNKKYASEILTKVLALVPEEFLLEEGDSNFNLEGTGDGKTPMDIALSNRDEKSVAILREALSKIGKV